jgi:hypothetical protein
MARISNFLLVALLVAIAAAMVSCAPPVNKHITQATTAEKMKSIKLATTSEASSQALADNSTDTGDQPDGISDDPDDQSKQGFFKNLIGSSPMDGMGGGDHHPSKDIPALVWALPIVGFIGVGIAVAAYCSFGT